MSRFRSVADLFPRLSCALLIQTFDLHLKKATVKKRKRQLVHKAIATDSSAASDLNYALLEIALLIM